MSKAWYFPQILDSTCVLALDMANGVQLLDSSPAIQDVALRGDVDVASEFDGVDDWVEVSDADSLEGMVSCTLMFWILASDTTSFEKLVQKADVFDIGINDGGNIFAEIVGVKNFSTLGASPTVDDTTSHHIALTFDGSTATAYIDGVAVESEGSLSGPLGSGTGSFGIGKHVVNDNEFYSSKIDRVFLFNRALTPQEIQDEFDNYHA